jgi:hypothetical protein
VTVGQPSAVCWTIFGVMCLAFLPLGAAILLIPALPAGVRVALAIIVVLGVWWGPSCYAMYRSLAVMRRRNGGGLYPPPGVTDGAGERSGSTPPF